MSVYVLGRIRMVVLTGAANKVGALDVCVCVACRRGVPSVVPGFVVTERCRGQLNVLVAVIRSDSSVWWQVEGGLPEPRR